MSHTRTFGRKYLRFQYKWHRRHNDDEDFSINIIITTSLITCELSQLQQNTYILKY